MTETAVHPSPAGLKKLSTYLLAWAHGQTPEQPQIDQYEGFAELASALNHFHQNQQTRQQESQTQQSILSAQVEALQELLQTSNEIGAQLLSSTQDTISHANFASNKGSEISDRNQALAISLEQMGEGIKEVATQTTTAASVVNQAQSLAQNAETHILELGNSSKEIGSVVQVITSIAQQTKLLALNATIEAARAGEAGKGFAVVANEVKELAKETAAATEDISQKIEAIQVSSQTSSSYIHEIAQIILDLEKISLSIASSVEEQATVSREISLHANDTAQDSTEITSKMQEVEQYNQVAAEIIEALQASNQEMLNLATELSKNL